MENKNITVIREENKRDFIIDSSLEFAKIGYNQADDKMAVADIADNSVSMGIALANSLHSALGDKTWDT